MAADVAFAVVADVAIVADDAIVAEVAIVAGVAMVADVDDVAFVVGIAGVVVVMVVRVDATEVVARTVGEMAAVFGAQAVNDNMAAKPISQISSLFMDFPSSEILAMQSSSG